MLAWIPHVLVCRNAFLQTAFGSRLGNNVIFKSLFHFFLFRIDIHSFFWDDISKQFRWLLQITSSFSQPNSYDEFGFLGTVLNSVFSQGLFLEINFVVCDRRSADFQKKFLKINCVVYAKCQKNYDEWTLLRKHGTIHQVNLPWCIGTYYMDATFVDLLSLPAHRSLKPLAINSGKCFRRSAALVKRMNNRWPVNGSVLSASLAVQGLYRTQLQRSFSLVGHFCQSYIIKWCSTYSAFHSNFDEKNSDLVRSLEQFFMSKFIQVDFQHFIFLPRRNAKPTELGYCQLMLCFGLDGSVISNSK